MFDMKRRELIALVEKSLGLASPAVANCPWRRVDRMIQCHSTRHPAASSVPSLQWLLFQQMHYHGSESRVMPVRGIELF